ncbi:MAG: metallophosphoesterase [Actinomycetota bacterium]|nr:metallophosphoesterase [Actinomycetota bacterium]
MTFTDLPLRIAHLSSIHCGEESFRDELMAAVVEKVNRLRPDLVVVAGDLTAAGYRWEFDAAAEWLERMEAPTLVVPGNHDSRNVGYVHFQRLFGERFWRCRQAFEPDRAERLRTTGVTVVGLDSSEPDLNEGRVGREWYAWLREQFDQPDDFKIVVLHHHLVAVPGAGRTSSVIQDAGDVLPILARLQVDMILSGHKHVPFFWGLSGMFVCNSGTAATWRVRGRIPPSWNEFRIDASTVKVFLHYPDGRRELSAIRTRASRAKLREAFHLTEDFLSWNHITS